MTSQRGNILGCEMKLLPMAYTNYSVWTEKDATRTKLPEI